MTASLASFRPPRRDNCKVVSLLGGIVAVQQTNPIDYTWRLARPARRGMLYVPGAALESIRIETKRNLIEKCGLEAIYRLAESLDLAIVSCGDIGPRSTSLSEGFISKQELDQLIEAGCVCDTMFNFLDAEGNSIDHPINKRVMSVDLRHAEEGQAHRTLFRRRPPCPCDPRHHQAHRLQYVDHGRKRGDGAAADGNGEGGLTLLASPPAATVEPLKPSRLPTPASPACVSGPNDSQ